MSMDWRRRWFPNGEWVLVLALLAEIAVFAAVSPNFATLGNAVEISRLSVELGLLALALTPIIVTGGIDLSVGSMMGLSAVAFGAMWQGADLPVPVAMALALLLGLGGGALNAALIARLRVPPLIVTLGTLSLFRGLAEAITQGALNYSGFPSGFLALGQGYLGGVLPAQLPILVLACAGYAVLLHRSVLGRALYTIGFSAAGARYAGIPVPRRVGLVYVLSGLAASVAGVVSVAHLGQANAGTGNGYELEAITAVVLGGASVFGGRGTIWGTLLGLFVLSVLRNGLQLAALPSELTGVLTGTLLVAIIAVDYLRSRPRRPDVVPGEEETPVKNAQVAVLCAAVLLGSLIVAATNVWLIRSVAPAPATPAGSVGTAPDARPLTIAMMPKAKGDPYFISCLAGAEEAAAELGVELLWDGPTNLDAARQNELVETWITRGVDAIAVAVENRAGISTVLRRARERGIPVITWDADAEADARDFFVNQATPQGIANALTDEAARLMGGEGEFAIITGALSAANQNEWIAFIRQRLEERYPDLTLATIRPSDDDRDEAFAETQTIMRAFPDVELVMAISAPAVPGAAEAVRQAGSDVFVIGLSLPNLNRPYVEAGVVQTVVLWDTRDLGYLAVHAAVQAARGELDQGVAAVDAGRLGPIDVRGSEIVLGDPLLITDANIDQFDF